MAKIKLLSSAMAAAKLGFTPDYIRRLCAEGTIKAEKIASDWLIDEKDIKDIRRKRKSRES
jgi:hypothetical protein